ncbi:barstar family protein [Kineosporia sp. J2-2]|uniref:Barstar family protein n=1 Tax=Kineosporia corallincola TaxID=2835133 RepID=A0ABS5TNH2_9ACTN|nr:barstar family protein [Kineosporia corallincola]MBT0772641.1 barstar family protein [Kineosporia corallincola]
MNQWWINSRPWLHLSPEDVDPEALRASAPVRPAVVLEFDGDRLRDLDSLFQEFAREFGFPEYFGGNWPAFAECIGDLAWLQARAYVVLIRRPELLLEASPADRDTFFRVMNGVCQGWANAFALPAGFGGGEVPFNLVLLLDGSVREDLTRAIGDYL